MMKEKVSWKPHPGPQTEVLTRTEYEILFGGARGGGKTDAGIAWLLRHIENPRYRALIIRKNAQDLSDWVDRAKEMYKPTGATFAYKPAEITFPSGAIFRSGHLKDENAFGKYIGHEYQRMVIEELTQIPNELQYLKLLSSCRSTVDGITPQIFCTSNPGDIGHAWVKRRFILPMFPNRPFKDKISGRERIYVPSRVTDNLTLMEKDPSYVKYLESLPDTQRKAWLDGNWDIVAGQIFTEWDQTKHVIEPFKVPKFWKRYIAMDWGVNNPTAVGWYTRDYEGRTYLYRERYFNGTQFHKRYGYPLTPTRLAKVILNINKLNKEDYVYCVADPSMWNKTISGTGGRGVEGEGESIAETMISAGLRMIKGDNDRVNGLGRYREMLSIAPDGKPWYQVFSTCRATIETIPSLPYDMKKVGGAEAGEDVDTDAEDHCYDRDRYFFMSRPTSPERVKVKRESLIRKFYRKAVANHEEKDELEEGWQEWLSW
ncbi:MAG: hypothetical protein GY861_05285 [bacterium]|nr:hypothetical protein [bacterium]